MEDKKTEEKKGEDKYIELHYKFEKNRVEKIRLFEEHFVKNNKDNCQIINKGKRNKIVEFFSELSGRIKEAHIHGNEIKIMLNIKKLTNMSQMFSGCDSLISFEFKKNFNFSNIDNNISYIFNGCTSLKTISGIDNWNISKINNIEGLFKGCISLESLPDIS